MNIWHFPIDRLQPAPRCKLCGRAISLRDGIGRVERICQACLGSTPEKRAA